MPAGMLLLQSAHEPCSMSHYDIKLYNPLIVNSTQGILDIIEYLLFQI